MSTSAMLNPTILVTGATGYIGGRLAPQLLGAGYRVVCLARDPARLKGRDWPGAEIRQGDILDRSSLRQALIGIHTAYYLVHSMNAGEAGFEERNRRAAMNFATAARQAGVKHIIHLGGLGSSGLSTHLESRQETGQLLRGSGIPVTEFRAAVIIGAGSASFELIRHLVERLPVMVCPRWVKTRCQPIAVDDVLRYLVGCLREPRAHGRILEIGGADVLSYRDMMLELARIRGLRRRIIDVPLMTPRLSSYWCDLVTPVPASIARPLIDGLRTEVVVREHTARALFDFVPRAYGQAVRDALDEGSPGTETVWPGSVASAEHRTGEARALTAAEGMIRERRQIVVRAPARDVFFVLSALGGSSGWLYANALWKLRGAVDHLVGGVGLRRGRRDPESLRIGDAVDWWRVEDIVPCRRILLRAEMKLPGRAWLEWVLTPQGPGETSVEQTAWFEARGLGGLTYWYALYPLHALIFGGMLRAIRGQAETAAEVGDADGKPASAGVAS